MDIDIKKMYYYLLSLKEASAGTMTYLISETRNPELNYCLAVTMTPRAKVLCFIVIFHALLLFLNIYVFAKLAEEADLSFYGKRRKY